VNLPSKNKQLTAPQTLSALICNQDDLTKAMKGSGDLTELFFPMPYGQKSGIIIPLLCEASMHCSENNITSENLQEALLTTLCYNSVRLDHPFSIIIKADDLETVQNFLTVCQQIAPTDSFIEVPQLSYEQLYRNPDKFKGKVIGCLDPKGFKKALPDIQNLILHGHTSRQEINKSKLGNGFAKHSIEYPVAIIGVETSDQKNDLDHPSILKITLSSNENPENINVSGYNNFQKNHLEHSLKIQNIKKTFERLSPCKVHVPFVDQISSHIIDQNVEKISMKFKTIQNIQSLVSITNNPPPVTAREVCVGYLNLSPAELHETSVLKPDITSTKADYYETVELLKKIILVCNDYYPQSQLHIFETVKDINLGKLKRSIIDFNDNNQVLLTLYKGVDYWAKLEDIYKRINTKSKKHLTVPAIDKELNKLSKLGIISKKKFPKTTDYGYFINVMSIGKHITFLAPSKIVDPVFNSKQVKVVNPLTGKIATI